MFLTRPSVSLLVSPVFLVSATPLKPLNRISWRFVWRTLCVDVHIHRKFWFNFFSPLLNFGQNERYYSKLFVSATPLKPFKRLSWNFVVMKDLMCRCAYPRKFLIQFFLELCPFFNLEIWPKFKILLKTVHQNNSTETAQQNCVKLCSHEGHNV